MTDLLTQVWQERPAGPIAADDCVRSLGVSRLTAEVLSRRPLNSLDDLKHYWSPRLEHLLDPFGMKDMKQAAERLAQAVRQQEKIVVWGDYDADGATSVALLMRFFRLIGARIDFHIPNRLRDGYGLNVSGLGKLAAEGAEVVVTVDNGITAVNEALEARRLGLDLIITDHHETGDVLPEALAVVDPKRRDCPYPDKRLAGVGVAFKLAYAVARSLAGDRPLSDEIKVWLLQSLALVALGTVADLVPLVGENRVLVEYGLKQLTNSPWPGLAALKEVAGVHDDMTCTHVAFKLGPRINAAGRLASADAGVRLLITEDTGEAFQLAGQLDDSNVQRRQIEQSQAREALKDLEGINLEGQRFLLLARENWHPGVIGIVASRLVDIYYLPVCVIALNQGVGKGSCRSIEGFHMQQALTEVRDTLVNYGGHAMAAGFSIEASRVDDLRERLQTIAARTFTSAPQRSLVIDTWVPDLAMLDLTVTRELHQLSPFGMDNPPPVLAASQVQVTDVRRMGRDGNHLSFKSVAPGAVIRSVAFNAGHLAERLQQQAAWDLVFEPKLNTFTGQAKVELDIKGLRPSGAAA